jgi:hypothetical protein
MARIIAREDYALALGKYACTLYSANRAVTKAQAVSFGTGVRGTYLDN